MALNLAAAQFLGPALPEPFVKFDLEQLLNQHRLLAKNTGAEGKRLQEAWAGYRRRLRELGPQAGKIRVQNFVIDPLLPMLGYAKIEDGGEVTTREGDEDGGILLVTDDGQRRLRVWTVPAGTDLEAPTRRGDAYRYSPVRSTGRVLLARQEHLGIVTDGEELRLLISEATRNESQIVINLENDWRRAFEAPDTFRFLLALASPAGQQVLPELIEKARLKQATVTKELRVQARHAIEGLIQQILDDPRNREVLATHADRAALAKNLWREGLIIVYRLLFVLKGEATDDPAKSFGFTGSSVWRQTYSPTVRLAGFVRKLIDNGEETGNLIEHGLRMMFKMFAEGIATNELNIAPLGGALFGENSTQLLSTLRWPERGCATLLDNLLWTRAGRGRDAEGRQRIHYGALDIEDLGRVYEALLELEPGIAIEPMCRLRRTKLEVVVPAAQGERYRDTAVADTTPADDTDDEQDDDSNGKSKIEWMEAIPAGRFFLRVGLGRKSSGSYYTPHSFVRFLVQETVGAKIDECSPKDDPYPNRILQLKVIDPAMGSGHFLVEACRFIGEKLYEACRLCDDKATVLEREAEKEKNAGKRDALLRGVQAWRDRIIEIPDPDDEILKYLPSAAPEGAVSGLSERKAQALCKRLAAVHCLYGVDKNPLAVELAKLSLWLESQSEGLPLTFLDHRLVLGDSLTGPFFEHLLKFPGSQQPLDDMFNLNLRAQLKISLLNALQEVTELNKSVGINLTEITNKQRAKERLDECLLSFKILAAAWAGSVMLGEGHFDDTAYGKLAEHIANTGTLPEQVESAKLMNAIAYGLGLVREQSKFKQMVERVKKGDCAPALPYDLVFPEVFFAESTDVLDRCGFDVVIGNPPWDKMLPADKEFFAAFDFSILNAPTKKERSSIQKHLLANTEIKKVYDGYVSSFRANDHIIDAFYQFQVVEVYGERTIGKQDAFRAFMERGYQCLSVGGITGVVVPSAFHTNEGATGIRRLYLNHMAQRCCYSFQNKRKLFEIHSQFKFATVVAQKGEATSLFSCAFYLQDDEWLFSEQRQPRPLTYTRDFVQRTGGEYLSLLELRSLDDFKVAEVCYSQSESFGMVTKRLGIELGRELNMTDDSWRFTDTEEVLGLGVDPRDPSVCSKVIDQGYVLITEGKSFWHFDDQWSDKVRSLVSVTKLGDKPCWLANARFFRLAYRTIQNSENERTLTLMILPPGRLFGNSANCDRRPEEASNWKRLFLQAIASSFTPDWLLRLKTTVNVNLFILNELAIPHRFEGAAAFFAHSALRLTCNHAGYTTLWQEQLGDVWREPKPKHTWPVLATDDERWEVRTAIDAVVAEAYGLTRDQYEHILTTFSHSSYPQAPQLCLAKFDELNNIGLEKFTKKYDPYWDVPLNEELPKPVIDLPIPNQVAEAPNLFGADLPPGKPRKTTRLRKLS